jgi:hypothetical protein
VEFQVRHQLAQTLWPAHIDHRAGRRPGPVPRRISPSSKPSWKACIRPESPNNGRGAPRSSPPTSLPTAPRPPPDFGMAGSRRWRTCGDSPSSLPAGSVNGQIDLFCKTVVVTRNLQCRGLDPHKKERPPRGGPRSSSTEVLVSRLGKPLASTCDNAQSQDPRSPRAPRFAPLLSAPLRLRPVEWRASLRRLHQK